MHLVNLLSGAVALASLISAACIRDDSTVQVAADTKFLFLFGDSYTRTHFEVSREKPSSKSPLGNPPWPGLTSAGGKNWVAHTLTERLPKNDTLTFNLAVGGSTIDRNTIPGNPKSTVTEQVKLWDDNYKNKPSYAKWSSSNAAVGIWIGINDIGATYSKANTEAVLTKAIDKYFSLLEHFYKAGIRIAFLIKVPPTQRTPKLKKKGAATVEEVTKAVNFYNKYLAEKAVKWQGHHSDLKVKVVEITEAFNMALDDPKKYGAKDNTCTHSDGKTCVSQDLPSSRLFHFKSCTDLSIVVMGGLLPS
ncbi:unnamed protein product [Clonostachys chloroleuca]|uniref:Acetylesterase n=1 Tax=Clonostachys chloroleuca TaxID=1926264 RepID=A0AA35Q324_9HYPO|nr:unnamed protein product [Clonostachys chloroleuca]